jgi:hypothetical protein
MSMSGADRLLQNREKALAAKTLYTILCRDYPVADPWLLVARQPRRSAGVSCSLVRWVLDRASGIDGPSTPQSCVLVVLSRAYVKNKVLPMLVAEYKEMIDEIDSPPDDDEEEADDEDAADDDGGVEEEDTAIVEENADETPLGTTLLRVLFTTGCVLKVFRHYDISPLRHIANNDLVALDDVGYYYDSVLSELKVVLENESLRPTQTLIGCTAVYNDENNRELLLQELARVPRASYVTVANLE